MLEIGVQTWNAVDDANPKEGFEMLRRAGFTCCDFSLNSYLKNTDIYGSKINQFFDASIEELREYFLLCQGSRYSNSSDAYAVSPLCANRRGSGESVSVERGGTKEYGAMSLF